MRSYDELRSKEPGFFKVSLLFQQPDHYADEIRQT